MQRTGFQMSVAGLLGLVAFAALNFWLFRISVLAGIVGLNITKHIVIAYLCKVLGVDRRPEQPPRPLVRPRPTPPPSLS